MYKELPYTPKVAADFASKLAALHEKASVGFVLGLNAAHASKIQT
jgi:hypothetical protein